MMKDILCITGDNYNLYDNGYDNTNDGKEDNVYDDMITKY